MKQFISKEKMMTEKNKEYYQVRVSKRARAHLAVLVPAFRDERGVNVSMADLASEAILSIPIPQPTEASASKKRVRKATEQPAQAA
jgi:hypothetical protein